MHARGYLTATRLHFAPKEHDGLLRLALVDHVRRRDGLVLLSRDAAAAGAQRPALHPVLYVSANGAQNWVPFSTRDFGPAHARMDSDCVAVRAAVVITRCWCYHGDGGGVVGVGVCSAQQRGTGSRNI